MSWHVRFFCPCGKSYTADFNKPFFLSHEHCPKCGCHKDRYKKKLVDWRSYATWWWPPSWARGKWIESSTTEGEKS